MFKIGYDIVGTVPMLKHFVNNAFDLHIFLMSHCFSLLLCSFLTTIIYFNEVHGSPLTNNRNIKMQIFA